MVVTARLSAATLDQLPTEVRRPRYDRSSVECGIVHLGPGAFHRVHQAWYAEQWLATDRRWGIAGVSLRSDALRAALAAQDGLYTLAVVDESPSFEVLGSLCEVLVAGDVPAAALRRVARPETRLLTMTVTEKGYCLDVDGHLDLTHPDVRHDLEQPRLPRSAIGFVVEGLRLRRELGLPPVPVMSCDNLAGNGHLLSAAVRSLAAALDPSLAAWIEGEVPFPCTMVDSITPATTPELRERVAAATGLEDAWPVQREAFVQWVVEEHRAVQSPDWAAAGVVVTNDVAGYERAKLRLLNGAHSTLAYVGLLQGHATVREAMQDDALAALVRELMLDDVAPTLRPVQGLDVTEYVDAVLRRFRNPVIRHELAQIAWDGSKKLPVRILGTVRDALAAGRPLDRLCVPLAAWMHFVRRRVAAGVPLVDPLSDRLDELARGRTDGSAANDVAAFLALGEVFPRDLAAAAPFRVALERAYARVGSAAAALT
jgi:fructuronate reductase